MKKEYFLKFWGEVENDNWIEKDLGIKEKNFWFLSSKERNDFKNKLEKVAEKHKVIIVFEEKEGKLTHKKTILFADLKYRNKNYKVKEDFGYEFPEETAIYMWKDGNNSCDCNRSLYIKRQCDKNFPDMKCGDKIELVKLSVNFQ